MLQAFLSLKYRCCWVAILPVPCGRCQGD